MRKILFVAMAMAAGSVGVSQAQSPAPINPTGVIAGRQAAYDMVGALTGTIAAGVKAGADTAQYKESAEALAGWGKAIPGMFPAGTETGHNTKARAEVWSDRAGFEKAAANLSEAAEKLATVAASGDKAAFADQFKATAGTCGACHRSYRAR